jgi:hypothetical protein
MVGKMSGLFVLDLGCFPFFGCDQYCRCDFFGFFLGFFLVFLLLFFYTGAVSLPLLFLSLTLYHEVLFYFVLVFWIRLPENRLDIQDRYYGLLGLDYNTYV